MTKRWNPASGQYEPFSPGERQYPVLDGTKRSQVDAIEPSSDGVVRYYPCRVRLRDGSWRDQVFIAESSEYIRSWGVWPDQDSHKNEVKIGDVVEIKESPSRLPRHLAEQLYAAGESGMGYLLFGLRYRDSTVSYHLAGNAVDFVTLPSGKTISDVIAVLPHEGRKQKYHLRSPEYAWCLFSRA